MQELLKYKKGIVAGVIGILQILSVYLMLNSDGIMSPTDWQTVINAVILSLGGTAGVVAVSNKKG